MSAVDNVRGQGHINRSVLHFLKSCRYSCQIFRIVDLRAKPVLNVKRSDIARAVKFIKSILGIALAVAVLTEFDYLIKPELPVLTLKLIKGLGFHSIVEKVDSHLLNESVPDNSLKVLLRQRYGR